MPPRAGHAAGREASGGASSVQESRSSAGSPFKAACKVLAAEGRSSSTTFSAPRPAPVSVVEWAPGLGAGVPGADDKQPAVPGSTAPAAAEAQPEAEEDRVAATLLKLKTAASEEDTMPSHKCAAPAKRKRSTQSAKHRARKPPVTIASLTAQLEEMTKEQESLGLQVQRAVSALPALQMQVVTQTTWLAAVKSARTELSAEVERLRVEVLRKQCLQPPSKLAALNLSELPPPPVLLPPRPASVEAPCAIKRPNARQASAPPSAMWA